MQKQGSFEFREPLSTLGYSFPVIVRHAWTLIRRNLSSTTWLSITNFRSKDSWQASVDFKAADDVLVNMAVAS